MKSLVAFAILLVFLGCSVRVGGNPNVWTGGGGGGGGSPGGGGGGGSVDANYRALLSWAAASNNPDGYLVLQSQNGTGWTATLTSTSTSAYVDGLTQGQTYYFRVAAFNSTGTTTSTGTASFTL